jgi:glycosyltransferase involved in cell wall biosynthesis
MLEKNFSITPSRIIVEPNGVAVEVFRAHSREEARTKLNLPAMEKIVLYVGRLYAWKGLEILPHAFARAQEVHGYIVGGNKKTFELLTKISTPRNMHIVEARPQSEIPLWLAAADVVLVLGTAKNDGSLRYTSPMKVFEYMAAQRPIVASRTPALREIFDEFEVHWYEPDNAQSLAAAMQEAVREGVVPSREKAAYYDWQNRAVRIVDFIKHAT